MRFTLVIERQVLVGRVPRLGHGGIGLLIHLLVFHRLPQPLDEHGVAPAAASVHADNVAVLLQQPPEGFTRELRAPVSFDDLRCVVLAERLLKCLHAEDRIHRDQQPSGEQPA